MIFKLEFYRQTPSSMGGALRILIINFLAILTQY